MRLILVEKSQATFFLGLRLRFSDLAQFILGVGGVRLRFFLPFFQFLIFALQLQLALGLAIQYGRCGRGR